MKVINILAFILIFIIVMPIIATMIPTGPVKFMTVTGNSMEPTITESNIIVVNTLETQPNVGDIVSYYHIFGKNQRYIVTHRVVKVVDEGYITQGDAYTKPDGYTVAPEDLVGTLFFKIPYVGLLVHIASTKKGFLALVIFPAVILIMQEVSNIIGQIKER
ncbi:MULTISPECIES: signal peptidase I [Methanosarcina]|uniref:Signal peptidase I n=4 Tax=Methanosarcina barkeri TaxID=2208 RepID=A0A0G3C5B2_METBA|nr:MULTISPECIES: signal peptidase I [Methanosarcina]AKB56594.1 Signal peptidase I [Methanosarcina barkeri 227]AKJ37174.1 signal peptidase I [Methanosarcina barkeri CM1]OED08288.1 signal peptidase I [Methanosarcina sp. A14]